MSKYLLVLIPTVLILCVGACSGPNEPDEKSNNQAGDNLVPELSEAEQIYNKNCKACHAQGINGAPILGNKAMWSKRLPQGKETLVQHAISGYGLMPAKGGRTELPDSSVEQVVSFMISKVQ